MYYSCSACLVCSLNEPKVLRGHYLQFFGIFLIDLIRIGKKKIIEIIKIFIFFHTLKSLRTYFKIRKNLHNQYLITNKQNKIDGIMLPICRLNKNRHSPGICAYNVSQCIVKYSIKSIFYTYCMRFPLGQPTKQTK